MKYRQIIHDAWELTQQNKALIKVYAFLPALLTIIVGIFYFAYQFMAYKSSKLFEGWDRSFLLELVNFIYKFTVKDTDTAIPVLITAFIVILFYLFLPAFCQGSMIQIIARSYNKQEVKLIEGVKYGLLSFLRILKFQLMMRSLSVISISATASIFLRSWGVEGIPIIITVFGLFMIIGFVLNLLFTYAEFFIVIDSEDVFPSISKSCGLVVSHWQMTFLIGILMLIIGVRILLQILLVLLIPALVIVPASYIAAVTLAQTGMIIGGVIGAIALFFAAYLSATINVFANAVWVITFLELSNVEETSARDAINDTSKEMDTQSPRPSQVTDISTE